ncbi:HlyD family secretion protein [Oleisolibacter albus]|uniref:HlyD family secretion protein n=1 Tax=Oleisolibacter albus TaxID=2171757 RepID=UPI000DF450B9|nr:HlyD family efflux transporter periplasmic adaptor subunit [Oleisolibacter albus]
MTRLPITLLPLLLLSACGGDEPPGHFQGYLEGDYLHIAAPEAGWLADRPVREGERVSAGTLLFTLEDTDQIAALAQTRAQLAEAESQLADLRLGSRPEELASRAAQVEEARATLRLARLDLDRQRKLAATNVAAQARLDQAEATAASAAATVARQEADLATARLPARSDRIAAAEATVEAARAAVARAEWQLSQRRVVSPADALVDDLVRDPGEWVPANGTVVSLLPAGGIKAVFFIPEPQRASVKPGDQLTVQCDGCAAGLTARVSRLATEAEYTPPVIFSGETRAKLVFRAEARLEGSAPAEGGAGLLPGQPLTLTVQP